MTTPDPRSAPPAEATSPRQTVLKQALIVLAGVLSGGIMITLGIWQLNVYSAQGEQQAEQRAAAPAVDLAAVAPAGEKVGDAYGRTVRFTGQYEADGQLLLPVVEDGSRHRVLTAFQLDAGGAVAVVRGVTDGDQAPAPPSGSLTQTGVLLPSQGAEPNSEPGADPTVVSLPWLAQQWQPDLVNGYVTLDSDLAGEQSLSPAQVALPSSPGRLRNGAYALQWWVFAAFAVGMSIKMSRDLGREAKDRSGAVSSAHPDGDGFSGS